MHWRVVVHCQACFADRVAEFMADCRPGRITVSGCPNCGEMPRAGDLEVEFVDETQHDGADDWKRGEE